MAKDERVLLSEAIEQLECTPSEIRRMIEDGELIAHRDDPTGPLLVSQRSIDDFLDAEDDDKPEVGDGFDAGYDEGWADALAERNED